LCRYFYFVTLALLSKMSDLTYNKSLFYISNYNYVVKILEHHSFVLFKGFQRLLVRI
jgi:hypothetical protein